MRRRLKILGALALPLLALGTGIEAQSVDDLPTLAVADFDGFLLGEAGNSAPVGKAVSTMLITELNSRDGMRVIERYRLQQLLQEQKLSLSGRVDQQTMAEIGNLVGAQYLVFGQVSGVASSMRMDVRLVDVETGEILEVQKLTDVPEALLDMVVRLADLFSAKLDLEPPSARPEVEEIPVRATIEFSRAVDYEDKGDTDSAIQHYQAALDIYPDHREAKKALERLQSGGEEDR